MSERFKKPRKTPDAVKADNTQPEGPGMFEAGGPGGPGRPKGARSRVARLLDDVAMEDAKDVLGKVLEMAKGGDATAARLVLDRVWPVPKGRANAVDLPNMLTANDVVSGVAAVVSAVAAGEISTEEGRDLAGILETHRKAIETTELEARIAQLETHAGIGGGR